MKPIPVLHVGDVLELKKPHPCGSSRWQIMRTGADFKLKCTGCGRMIMLSYEDFKKRVRRRIDIKDAGR